jgi:hypothetical protein
VALSGDFYATPDELYWEKPASIPWLWEANDLSDIREAFKEELSAIAEQQRGGVEYPDHNMAFWWNAKAYLELALDNTDHFGWHNLKAYCHYHGVALDLARQAREWNRIESDKADNLWRQALFTNAFADHFLTDAFAAGHIRIPRREIRYWAQAQHYPDKLAGVLSKLLHDQDGHLTTFHGAGHSLMVDDAEGLQVLNSLEHAWHTRCDGQLFLKNSDGKTAVRLPVEAVQASVKELFEAYLSGKMPVDTYAATRLVPFPDSRGRCLCDKFPATPSSEWVQALLESVSWYARVPYLSTGGSTGLTADHIMALFDALPELLKEFRQGIEQDVAANPELGRCLPAELIEGFKSIQ